MRIKEHLTVSNLLYAGSMLFALGVLAKVWLDRYQLEGGACPIDNNRPFLYLALAVLIIVNIGSFLFSYWKKK